MLEMKVNRLICSGDSCGTVGGGRSYGTCILPGCIVVNFSDPQCILFSSFYSGKTVVKRAEIFADLLIHCSVVTNIDS